MVDEKKFLDQSGVEYLWSQLSLEDYPNNETLIAVLNAIDTTKADKDEIPEIIKKYFLVVETVKDGKNYLLDGITFNELYNKFQLGNVNMVCHVDGTDYIPLLSVTSSKIIFSGIYNTTSVSLDFNSEGIGTLTSTYLCNNSNLTAHTSNKNIHITSAERNRWNDTYTKTETDSQIANLINSAPETLDTLGELAEAFQENKKVVDVLNDAIVNKANKNDIVQSDWNQNDETAADYIKNRPFYEHNEVLVDTVTVNNGDTIDTCSYSEGDIVTVIWDGVSVEQTVKPCEFRTGRWAIIYNTIGNQSLLNNEDNTFENTGEDFLIYYQISNELSTIICDENSHTLSIIKHIFVEIDDKFLPNI